MHKASKLRPIFATRERRSHYQQSPLKGHGHHRQSLTMPSRMSDSCPRTQPINLSTIDCNTLSGSYIGLLTSYQNDCFVWVTSDRLIACCLLQTARPMGNNYLVYINYGYGRQIQQYNCRPAIRITCWIILTKYLSIQRLNLWPSLYEVSRSSRTSKLPTVQSSGSPDLQTRTKYGNGSIHGQLL
jgi:hypothetical protein